MPIKINTTELLQILETTQFSEIKRCEIESVKELYK